MHQQYSILYDYVHNVIPGFGISASALPSFSAVNHKFPIRHIGVVINSVMMATNVGPILLILIYNYVFLRDGSYESQDIRGFFFFLAVYFFVTNLLAILVFNLSLKDDHISESMGLMHADHQHNRGQENVALDNCEDSMNENVNHQKYVGDDNRDSLNLKHEYTLKEVLRSPRLHLTVWPAGILSALKFVGISNISTLLNAYGLTQYEANAPFIQPAGSLIFKPLLGLLSDYTKDHFSRAWYLVAAVVVFIIWFIVAIYALDNFVVFCFVMIMWAVAGDAAYIQPAVFSDDFGKKYFGMNMSFILCTIAFFVFIPQAWFSAIYQYHADPEGLCYGHQCFTLSLVLDAIVAAACGLSFSCYLYLVWKEKINRKWGKVSATIGYHKDDYLNLHNQLRPTFVRSEWQVYRNSTIKDI